MIRAYEKKDYDAVVALWQEAFGDTEEDIFNCMYYFSPYLTLYTQEDALLGMFMRLPVESGGKKGDYIYAVATAKCARGRGIATELLDTAKARIKNGERDFLVLVPAKPSLFDFYEKRGFAKGAYISVKNYTHKRGIQTDVTVQNITPEQMYVRRSAHFETLAAWDENMLAAIDRIYGSDCYYELKGKNGSAFCMAYISGQKLIVPELCLQGMDEAEAFSALDSYFGTDEALVIQPDKNGEAFAMFYPTEAANMYFNIAIN